MYRPGAQGAHVDYLSRYPIECLAIDVTPSEWIKVAQIQDPDIETIMKILESGDNQASTKHYFETYDLRNGVVFRRTENGNRWLVPRASRFHVVKMCHDDQGHLGIDKTLEKLREHYWFKGMKRFVSKYVTACLQCLYYKSTSGRKPGMLHPIEKVALPFHTIHIDHVGPFVKSKRGNTQILTIVDGFTKFCILEPVKDVKTKWVIRALTQLFSLFGVPSRIISDRGTSFTSQLFDGFCKEYNIKHVLNAMATPRANGQCERMNRTLLNSLATSSAGSAEDQWDKFVKTVQSGINSATNRTTQKTPAQLLLGYRPRSMADSVLLGSIQSSLAALDLREMREQAKAATGVEQEKQKARFDAKRSKPPQYTVGDIVVVATNPVATGQSNKLVAKSKGPFKVTAVLPNDRYEVQDLREMQKSRGQKTVVAVDRIKKWISFNALE